MRMRLSAAMLAAGAVAGVIGTFPASAAAATAPQYKLVLGALNTEYLGINGRGDIIGLGVQPGTGGREEGFILKAGATTPLFLGAPGDETNQHTHTRPRSINDQGVVVGNYQKVIVFPGGEAEIPRPTIWPGPDGTGTDFGVNPTGDADAFGINGNGQIVGTQAGSVVTPWLKSGATVTNLPTPAGATTTEALALNINGVVVGDAEQPGGTTSAVQWVNGAISTLGTLGGGTFAEALAINKSGQVVGSATPPGAPLNLAHAVVFSNGRAIDLNVPGSGQGGARATAINSSGVIVGEDGIDPDLLPVGNGFIVRNGQVAELNTLIARTANVRLAAASGINDAGVIVGTADVTLPDGTQTDAGYKLVPIS